MNDSELTDRLRAHGRLGIVACTEAADRIEALEAELADADQDLYHVFKYLASAETELNRQAAT